MIDSGSFHTDLRVPNKIIRFFEEYLCVTTNTGTKPFMLMEWQKEIIREVFGTYRQSGLRRYKTAYIEVPRGNGKTALLAGFCLYSLIETFDAEVVAAAAARHQAAIMFQSAVMMIEQSPKLQKAFKVYKNAIYYPKQKSIFKTISRDANTALGGRLTFGCIDEVLAQPDDMLYSSLRSSLTKRPNSLLFLITTAGDSMGTLCSKLHEHAQEVAGGVSNDDSFYSKIYGLEEGEDWLDEQVWHKCNPGLGTIIDLETFRVEARAAESMPGASWIFKSRNLNAWLSGEKTWIKQDNWNKCANPTIKIDDFVGCAGYAGLDLSSVSDLTCLSLCFPRGEKYHFFPFIFCPEEKIKERSRIDKVLYETWAEQGYLIPTPGNVVDQEYILHKAKEIAMKYNIVEVAVDRWNATYITTKLQEVGFEVISFGQGYASMSEPTKFFEKLVMTERLVHPGNALFDWCINNVVLQIDPAGNYKPAKDKAGNNRIDPVVASIMAVGRAMLSQGESQTNIAWV